MSNITVSELFSGIANAIRTKKQTNTPIVADRFPYELASIPDNTLFISILDKTVTNIPDEYLSNLTSIGNSAFEYCTNLALTSLPEGITTIGSYAFHNCTNLALTSLPKSITSIDDSAFYNCRNLRTITFKGTPSVISNAFGMCYNLRTINVPWSEGAVAGAPWGATNATINYNYTGG